MAECGGKNLTLHNFGDWESKFWFQITDGRWCVDGLMLLRHNRF